MALIFFNRGEGVQDREKGFLDHSYRKNSENKILLAAQTLLYNTY